MDFKESVQVGNIDSKENPQIEQEKEENAIIESIMTEDGQNVESEQPLNITEGQEKLQPSDDNLESKLVNENADDKFDKKEDVKMTTEDQTIQNVD